VFSKNPKRVYGNPRRERDENPLVTTFAIGKKEGFRRKKKGKKERYY